jgi:hypothetical protein
MDGYADPVAPRLAHSGPPFAVPRGCRLPCLAAVIAGHAGLESQSALKHPPRLGWFRRLRFSLSRFGENLLALQHG